MERKGRVKEGRGRRREGEREAEKKIHGMPLEVSTVQLITLKTDSYRGRSEQDILSLCNELYFILK